MANRGPEEEEDQHSAPAAGGPPCQAVVGRALIHEGGPPVGPHAAPGRATGIPGTVGKSGTPRAERGGAWVKVEDPGIEPT